MVGQDDLRAVGDEKIAVDLDSGGAQGAGFFQERERIEYNAVTDYAAAAAS